MTKLIFGCGYLGKQVARRWLSGGQDVYALTRSTARAAEFQSWGVRPVVGDLTRPLRLLQLPPLDTVLFSVGFDHSAGQSVRDVYVDGMRHVLDAFPGPITRIIISLVRRESADKRVE